MVCRTYTRNEIGNISPYLIAEMVRMKTYIVPYPYAYLVFIKMRITINNIGNFHVEAMQKCRLDNGQLFAINLFAQKLAELNK